MPLTDDIQILEHTADIGIQARAASLGELFARMGQGLTALLFGAQTIIPRQRRTIRLRAADRQELLVDWLNELIFLGETQGFIAGEFHVAEIDSNHLQAVIGGERFDPTRHLVEREAKAATYHQLKLEQTPTGWLARVYIDL